MDTEKPPMSRLARRASAGLTPIVVPVVNSPYALSNSGTYTEGDFQIGADGLKLGMENLQVSASAISRNGDTSTSESSEQVVEDGTFSVLQRDLVIVGTIGSGSSGIVHKTLHKPTGTKYALKVIQMNIQEDTRKNIIQELRTLHKSYCKQVVALQGAFFKEGSISIVLEFMDGGSISDLLRASGALSERHLRFISHEVLLGLEYLHSELHIIHRDIKPANLLVSYAGDVKISDFGVSGQLSHSVSKCQSWVGTVTYMSPERISGGLYSFDSDCWSVGLALMECATGRFPYYNEGDEAEPLGFWDLLDCIVEREPPALAAGRFSGAFVEFTAACLRKDPKERATVAQLSAHAWLEPIRSGGEPFIAGEAASFAAAVRGAAAAKQRMERDSEKEKEWSREEYEYMEAPAAASAPASAVDASAAPRVPLNEEAGLPGSSRPQEAAGRGAARVGVGNVYRVLR